MLQSEVAAKAGISVTHYSRIESAQSPPPLPLLPKLAEALSVSVGELLENLKKGQEGEFQQVNVEDLEDLVALLNMVDSALKEAWAVISRMLKPEDRGETDAAQPDGSIAAPAMRGALEAGQVRSQP